MDMKTGVKFEGKTDILKGRWHELKGQVRQQWGKLTDDDLAKISGKQEELAGLLQKRYGYAKERAELEINNFLGNLDKMYNASQQPR